MVIKLIFYVVGISNFPDSCEAGELFGEFVDTLYKEKSTASDNVQKFVAKLTLNSTYGKFGQRDKEYTIKLLHKAQTKQRMLLKVIIIVILQKYRIIFL